MAALDASASAGHGLVTWMSVWVHDVAKPRTAEPRADKQGNTFYIRWRRYDGRDSKTAAIFRRILSTPSGSRFASTCITRESNGMELSDAALRRFIRRVGLDNVEREPSSSVYGPCCGKEPRFPSANWL